MARKKIRLAVAGVGNCAASLIQGIAYYHRKRKTTGSGLMHFDLGGYRPGDIEVVAAFDVDRRKVGKSLGEAVFSRPNCTFSISKKILSPDVKVQMAPVLDGVSSHMEHYAEDRGFRVSSARSINVEKSLSKSGADILVNYLPVGSEQAARYYAQCCLNTGVSFVNCIPVFIVSDPEWGKRFFRAGIPCIGDDIKAQVGATIVHRVLTRLFHDRGVELKRTYQLNVGGNTDFLNMHNQGRLESKRLSKTQAVQSQLDRPLDEENIHIGPSDYVPWYNDQKVCFLRMEGEGFAGAPMEIELRLRVEDSPNSAGVAIDAIRCCQLARERGEGGPLESVSAYLMKHPPKQFPDYTARDLVERFIAGSES